MGLVNRLRLYPKTELEQEGWEYSSHLLDAAGNEVFVCGSGTAGPVTSTGVSYAVKQTDDVIIATAGGITVTLPKAADSFVKGQGRDFVVRNTAGTSITVAVAASGGNVDAGATATITTNTSKRFRSDGTNWWSI